MAGSASPVILDKLNDSNGRPTGFNYLRLFLALSVVLIHVPQVTYGIGFAYQFWMPWLRPAHATVVPVFFALSGFLVASSLLRCRTLISFFGLRIIRIAPALSVEVFLSALVLGPIFTKLSLAGYFSDSLFARYFFNLVGHVQFELPGVFSNNPFPDQVNAQLWTVPAELKCYVLLGILSLPLTWFNRFGFLICAVAADLSLFVIDLLTPLTGQINVSSPILVACFLAGVALYLYRDRMPWHGGLFLASLAAIPASLLLPHCDALIAFPAAYVVAYLGVLNPRNSKILFGGDYSYGIYLYGFPIQQAVIATVPGAGWPVQLIVSLALILACAASSWWLVEKPSLRLRSVLDLLEGRLMRRDRNRDVGIVR